MFHSARIKLTVWYLTIIMLISILFSVAIYRISVREFERGFNRLSLRRIEEQRNSNNLPNPQLLEPGYLQATENRIGFTLLYINLAILGIAGVGGYFLAGRTLKPIKIMVDEQDRFITDASHELRTPLTSLKTEIEVYLRSKKRSLTEANDLIKSNLEEINALQTLSDNLLQLSGYSKLNTNILLEKVRLLDVVKEACRRIASLARNKNITILNKTKKENVRVDKRTLVQLFVILLENAVKYSPNNSKVTITSSRKDNLVYVDVKDQGRGIDKKDLPHIFDRFFRADLSRSRENIPGYGLGLSIAKKIIEINKGSVSVKSELNKGTIFTVQLELIS